MSWVAVAVVGTTAVVGAYSSNQAAKAAEGAANTQAAWQTQALEYLKETEALPQEYREFALGELAGQVGYGERGDVAQQEAIDRARQSPLYSAIMGGREAGEEAIIRQASATGGLRGGNLQEDLFTYSGQLQNQALLQSYQQQQQGLQGLAGLPSLAPAIAGQMGAIGTTQAQGQLGQAQAQQAGLGMGVQTGISMANLFI